MKRTWLRQSLLGQSGIGRGEKSSNAYDIAIDCAAIGDANQALDWLEKALQIRDQKITVIGVEPIFDDLRHNPPFLAILNQVGLKTPEN